MGGCPSNRGRFQFPYQQPSSVPEPVVALRAVRRLVWDVYQSLSACRSSGLVQGPSGSPQGYRQRGTLDVLAVVSGVEQGSESARRKRHGRVAKPDGAD